GSPTTATARLPSGPTKRYRRRVQSVVSICWVRAAGTSRKSGVITARTRAMRDGTLERGGGIAWRRRSAGASRPVVALAPRLRIPKRGSFLPELGCGAVRFPKLPSPFADQPGGASHVDRPVGAAPTLHHCRDGAAHSGLGHVVPHAHDRGHLPRHRHPGRRRRVELSRALGRGDGAAGG